MSLFHLDLDFDRKLIDLIKANPILYEKDLRTTPYTDMKKKFELWSHIATSLNRDTKYCILRWKSLRGKYRREVGKLGKESEWELLEPMKFIDKHIKYQGKRSVPNGGFDRTQRNLKSPEHQTVPFSYNNMDAEQLIEEIHEDDDDPLQEAMDEQISTDQPSNKESKVFPTHTYFMSGVPEASRAGSIGIQHSSSIQHSSIIQHNNTMKRIEALLEGLGEQNRCKAEKRIVAYLCKCQLKALNNEDVDNVDI